MWLSLALTLLDWLGPIARKWIEDLLLNATANRGESSFHPNVAVNIRDLFANARAQTWRWQIQRRRVIDVCERYAVGHADVIASALRNGQRPIAPVAVLAEIAKVA